MEALETVNNVWFLRCLPVLLGLTIIIVHTAKHASINAISPTKIKYYMQAKCTAGLYTGANKSSFFIPIYIAREGEREGGRGRSGEGERGRETEREGEREGERKGEREREGGGKRERGRERGRGGSERARERWEVGGGGDRQTDRQTDREKQRETETEGDRDRNRDRNRDRGKKTETETETLLHSFRFDYQQGLNHTKKRPPAYASASHLCHSPQSRTERSVIPANNNRIILPFVVVCCFGCFNKDNTDRTNPSKNLCFMLFVIYIIIR